MDKVEELLTEFRRIQSSVSPEICTLLEKQKQCKYFITYYQKINQELKEKLASQQPPKTFIGSDVDKYIALIHDTDYNALLLSIINNEKYLNFNQDQLSKIEKELIHLGMTPN
jgi:hypothetical protein